MWLFEKFLTAIAILAMDVTGFPTLRLQRRTGAGGPRATAHDEPRKPYAGAKAVSQRTMGMGMPTVLSTEDIQRIIPQRHPFSFVDKVIEYEPGKRAVGVKCVTFNEQYFIGHFPDRPIMPGALQVDIALVEQ
jgi:hypothetical protein